MSFPQKLETIKRDVLREGMDTSFHGYDSRRVDTRLRGYDKRMMSFPRKRETRKKVWREGEWIPAYAGMTLKRRVWQTHDVFPAKAGNQKEDVTRRRVDTRLRGYDIKETGMTTHDVFPAKVGKEKKRCEKKKNGYPFSRVWH